MTRLLVVGANGQVGRELRRSLSTLGEVVGATRDGKLDTGETWENRRLFWIPEGFAHGFAVLSERAVFSYLCTDVYVKEADAGVRWNDGSIGVDWPVSDPLLSAKDEAAPLLADIPADRLPIYAA